MKCISNANDSTYITLSLFFLKSHTFWVILKYYVFSFSNMYWHVGHKLVLIVSNANIFPNTTKKMHSVMIRALNSTCDIGENK